jgi:hypothetical protein
MALTENTARVEQIGVNEDLPVAASARIFQGAAVGIASGYARGLVAGDKFAGFATVEADNRTGLAGAINSNVKKRGSMVLAVTGVTIASNARTPVYAADDGTFTTTVGSNTLIGNVARFVSAGVAVVDYKASEG